MLTQPILITNALLLLVPVMALIIVAIVISYLSLIKRYSRLKDKLVKLEEYRRQEPEELIAQARAQAQKILTDTTEARARLSEAEGQVRSQLLQKVQGDADQMVQSLSKDIKGQVLQGARETQHAFVQSIAQETKKATKDIEKYKAQKIGEIDQKVHDVINQVAQEVLGKSISRDEHQQLIVKALEEAKKNNIF